MNQNCTIVLYLDRNENMQQGNTQCILESLGLVKTLKLFSNKPLVASHISES